MSLSKPNPSRRGLDCDSFFVSSRSPWKALPPARVAPPPTTPRRALSAARACCCGARWPEPPSSLTGAETEADSVAAAAAVAPPPLPARNRCARGWRSNRLLPARIDGLAARGGAAAVGSRPSFSAASSHGCCRSQGKSHASCALGRLCGAADSSRRTASLASTLTSLQLGSENDQQPSRMASTSASTSVPPSVSASDLADSDSAPGSAKGLRPQSSAAQHLGCQVAAAARAAARLAVRPIEPQRQPKVSDAQLEPLTRAEQNALGTEVAVHHMVLVDDGQSAQRHPKQLARVVLRVAALPAVTLGHLREEIARWQ
eukprot:scaffold45232_cov63-Phaeocystis_antarctica.AAC.2